MTPSLAKTDAFKRRNVERRSNKVNCERYFCRIKFLCHHIRCVKKRREKSSVNFSPEYYRLSRLACLLTNLCILRM